MTGIGDDFWWNVLRRSTECPGLVSWWNLFGEAQINQTNVSVVVDHQIFRFQITVAVVTLVKVVESFDNTGNVESTSSVIEWTLDVQCAPQVT